MAKCAPASTLCVEALDFVIEIVGHGIDGDADGEVRRAAERLAGPVGALIQAVQNFHQADGVDFVNAAGFGMIAERRRIAGDGQHVAHAADGPGAQQHGLQADDVRIARGEVRNGFDAARFERAGHHQRVHAHAGHACRC